MIPGVTSVDDWEDELGVDSFEAGGVSRAVGVLARVGECEWPDFILRFFLTVWSLRKEVSLAADTSELAIVCVWCGAWRDRAEWGGCGSW